MAKLSTTAGILLALKWLLPRTKLSFFLSILTVFLVFCGVRELTAAFVSSLVTLDGILIAILAFIIPFAVRVFRVEQLREKLEVGPRIPPKPLEDRQQAYLLDLLVFVTYKMIPKAISAGLILLPVVAVVPYFFSAIFAMAASLRTGIDSLVLGMLALWITLWEFFCTLQLLWIGVQFYWSSLPQPPKIPSNST